MPGLIAEMKDDLQRDGQGHIREIYLLSHGWTMGGGAAPHFRYYFEDHADLEAWITLLENNGYLLDTTRGKKVKTYRFTEQFVEDVLGS